MKTELIDILKEIKKVVEETNSIIRQENDRLNKSINSDAIKESRNISENKELKEFCDICGNTGRGYPTLEEPDGIECECIKQNG